MIRASLARAMLVFIAMIALQAAAADPKRGEYLVRIAGCQGCHTEDKKGAVPFAGGRALKTPFGTFFGPNITPDPKSGIGRWSEADFVRAMREGKRPDGANFFPAFPYPSFTKIRQQDLRDIWSYLRELPPSPRANQSHDLRFPYGWRFAVTFWKWLYFRAGPFTDDPRASATVNRGAYLVQALSHCGECHTPRNVLGAPMRQYFLAGGRGVSGDRVPNLTPVGLELWSDAELKEFFKTGVTREGDATSEEMDEVVRTSTSRMTPEDLASLVAYLRTLPRIDPERR